MTELDKAVKKRNRLHRAWKRAANRVKILRKKLRLQRRKPVTMYDAVTVNHIPKTAEYVAGYVGGNFVTYPILKHMFPHAKHVLSIAVAHDQNAECVDCEKGDVPPDRIDLIVSFVRSAKARGVKKPKIYASVSQMESIINGLEAHGIHRTEVRIWTAHYTHRQHLCNSSCGFGFTGEADATQWTDIALETSLDLSLCKPRFFD